MKPQRANRFSNRTVLLMVLALVVFWRLWCQTHPAEQRRATPDSAPLNTKVVPIEVMRPGDAGVP